MHQGPSIIHNVKMGNINAQVIIPCGKEVKRKEAIRKHGVDAPK